MGFLYYLPGANTTPAAIAAAGLSYAFDGLSPIVRPCHRGPEGAPPGHVLAWRQTPSVEVDLLEGQTWIKIPGSECMVGYTSKPGPADLARAALAIERPWILFELLLGDGQAWDIPTALLPDRSSPLPKVRKLKPDGSIEKRVVAEFEELLLAADEVFDAWEKGLAVEEPRAWSIACLALSTNYRVSEIEISILELLTDDALNLILAALVDASNWPSMIAAAAKGATNGQG